MTTEKKYENSLSKKFECRHKTNFFVCNFQIYNTDIIKHLNNKNKDNVCSLDYNICSKPARMVYYDIICDTKQTYLNVIIYFHYTTINDRRRYGRYF